MKISIDKEACIGCGACESICPSVFVMKDDKAVAKKKESDDKCVKDATDSCPVNAIVIK